MTKLNEPMKPLYEKLKSLGFKKAYIKKMLPDWWDDSLASTKSGYQQAAIIFAQIFNVNYKSLVSEQEPCFEFPIHCFKKQKHIETKNLDPATSVALSVSRLVLKEFDRDLKDLSMLSAQKIRDNILQNNPWVDFISLLNYCWDIGIPVIFLKDLPSPKMQGIALNLNKRPIIVLTNGNKHGYLVFDLAHELGHIIKNHISDNSWVLDDKIKANDTLKQEKEANEFALELLTGKDNTVFSSSKILTAEELSNSALSYGRKYKIDPMHVILNYAYSQNIMSVGKGAINYFVKDQKVSDTDQAICQTVFLRNFDIDRLGDREESLRHLMRV